MFFVLFAYNCFICISADHKTYDKCGSALLTVNADLAKALKRYLLCTDACINIYRIPSGSGSHCCANQTASRYPSSDTSSGRLRIRYVLLTNDLSRWKQDIYGFPILSLRSSAGSFVKETFAKPAQPWRGKWYRQGPHRQGAAPHPADLREAPCACEKFPAKT